MASEKETSFPTDYINFDHGAQQTTEETLTKNLTFIGASAVSLLSYEAGNAAEILRNDDKFELVRKYDIVSTIWSRPVIPDIHAKQVPPLLAWSTRLQTLFVGFRGTMDRGDLQADLNIRAKSDPILASRFHAGFHQRAVEYYPLVRDLAKHYKVVVCGHSLG